MHKPLTYKDLLEVGSCCGNICTNCPYEPKYTKGVTMSKAIFKFNNGLGALLCSKCSIIIKQGKDFTPAEHEASVGASEMQAQFCEKCDEEVK